LVVESGPGAFSRAVADVWKNLPKEAKMDYIVESQKLKIQYMEQNPEIYQEKMKLMSNRAQANKLQKLRDFYGHASHKN
jgi:hypothetical protein